MKRFILFLLSLGLCGNLSAGDPPGSRYEQSLLDTIRDIQSLNYEQALSSTRDLIKQYPHSRLGHMLYADLLLAKAEPLTEIGHGIEIDRAMQDFRYEIRQRWQHDAGPPHTDLYPENILLVADDQPYVILVDQQSSRVYVYRNIGGDLQLETDYFITIGLKGYGKQKRGDQKTPIGIYHVTRYIDGNELPDLYGEGAFPINYPNAWDLRQKRTGGGIWIHGTPSYTYNRSPWASNGCIVVSNPDFLHIDSYISPGLRTPVVVADQVNWISRDQWLGKRQQVMQLLSTWLSDWESLDHDRYSRHYSRVGLDAYGRDFVSWDGHKRWVNRNKTWVEVEYSKLSIFAYPGEEDLLLMQFEQSYRSNNLSVDSPKEIFWRKNTDQWKIVYEGNRTFPVPDTTIVEN
ncbi:MAG: L,D-transpeptidase family protein [Gammaproteobacteria bacterium]|nr:L,D-transpeptidase family protein [Gammaproteobacteria bacterium]MDH3534973.1 L,D-transpeptidase family protein [Gammaproteobacteria bacterium]